MDEVVIRGEKDGGGDHAGGSFFMGWALAESFLDHAGPMGQYVGAVFGIPGPGGSNLSWLNPTGASERGQPQPGQASALRSSGDRAMKPPGDGNPYSDGSLASPVPEVYVTGTSSDFWSEGRWYGPSVSINPRQLHVQKVPSAPRRAERKLPARRDTRREVQLDPPTESDEDVLTVYVRGTRPERDAPRAPASERQAPARVEDSAFTATEWVPATTQHSLIPMVASVDTGSTALNFVLNKVLLPWRNVLASIENAPFEMAGALDDAMRSSRLKSEWQALESMSPLFPAMALSMRATGTVAYLRGVLAGKGRLLSDVSRALAMGFVSTGGIGGYVRGGKPIATKRSIDLVGRHRSGNSYKRVVGVERTYAEVLDAYPDYVSLGRELEFRVRRLDRPQMKPIAVWFDELFVTSDGSLKNMESKFGWYARPTRNQARAGYSEEAWLVAIPSQATVQRTGLALGEPVLIQTWYFPWAWEL